MCAGHFSEGADKVPIMALKELPYRSVRQLAEIEQPRISCLHCAVLLNRKREQATKNGVGAPPTVHEREDHFQETLVNDRYV